MTLKLDLTRIASLTIAVVLYIIAFGSPLLATHDPLEVHLVEQPQIPNQEHLFGTDQLGRDLFSRSLYALRHSLIIATVASLSILLVGTLLGLIGGYFGGIIDWLLIASMDCMLAFPSLLLTLGICAILGAGSLTILLSLVLTGWASMARIIRSTVQSIKTKEYVIASRLLGAGHLHVIRRHIIPHCTPVLRIFFVMTLATSILAESSLSFLGFGLPPPYPTLGKLVYEGARFFRVAPWWSFFPGLLIALSIVSLNLLGDSMRRKETYD